MHAVCMYVLSYQILLFFLLLSKDRDPVISVDPSLVVASSTPKAGWLALGMHADE